MCGSFTLCGSRCEGMESHMHCHYCGYPLSLESKADNETNLGGYRLSVSEALWRCTSPECGKTELVSSGVREAPFGCDCQDLFAD